MLMWSQWRQGNYKLNIDDKISLLKDEYIKLHDLIDSFDDKTLKIKEMSITVSIAAIGGAYVAKEPLLLLLASFSGFVFWIIEYQWKSFQMPHFERVREIEKLFQNGDHVIEIFQISHNWDSYHNNLTFMKKIRILTYANVLIPHLVTFVVGALLYILYLYDIIPIVSTK